MPQDKRLIVTRAVVNKLKKVSVDVDAAASIPVFLSFIVPPALMTQDRILKDKLFLCEHCPFPRRIGKRTTTVLIVPNIIVHDCAKINKRHNYFDAVVAAELICRRGDLECEKRALQVSSTFTQFVVDARIVTKLPLCIKQAVDGDAKALGSIPQKQLVSLPGFEERESLGFTLSQGALGTQIVMRNLGQCLFRVGHGGMTAGEVCDNAKGFVASLKVCAPHIYKYVADFKLISPVTEMVRFSEANIKQ